MEQATLDIILDGLTEEELQSEECMEAFWEAFHDTTSLETLQQFNAIIANNQ